MFQSLKHAARPAMTAAAIGLILPTLGALCTSASAAVTPRLARTAVYAAQSVKPDATATLTFKQIDDPADPTFNQLLGIDDQGVISGYFGSGAAKHPNKGYTIAPPYNTASAANFLADNLPGSTQTQATGITPAATTAGFWAPTDLGVGLDQNYGFVRFVSTLGVVTWVSINDPLGAPSNPKTGVVQATQVLGVNKLLNAVGFYVDANAATQGFVYSINTGTYSHPFVDKNAVSSAITGINDHNTICGFFTDLKGHTKGFVQMSNGANVHYLVPGSTITQFLGVNSANEAVGFYQANANDVPHGILYNANTNVLTKISVPGASSTVLNGINDKGQAVGFFTDNNNPVRTHGVLVGNVP